jgi:hypothetical protein
VTTEENERVRAIRAQSLQQIEQVRGEMKPTYWVDGQRVHWEQYVESLQRTVDWCDRRLADDQPFEVRSEGGER